MNSHKRGILIGMLLGDGCIKLKHHTKQNGKKSVYAEYVIDHSEKQLRYLQYKASKLHSMLGGKPWKIGQQTHYLKATDKTYTSFRISRCHKYFRLLHRWAYSNFGKKYFCRKVLDMLNPEGIAYWFQDDGGLVLIRNNAGEISSFQVRLYTYCSLEEAETIQEYFTEVWSVRFNVKKHTGKEQYTLRANTKEANKFMGIIYDYQCPGMEYKFIEPRVQDTPRG